jgi:hypothetical protein
MKGTHIQIFFFIFYFLMIPDAFSQYNWKLTKNNDGIAVYQSAVNNSAYKSIKVEFTVEGNYDKLIGIITNVNHYTDWVYNNKTASLLKTISPLEFYYYSETYVPWPMSNRDAVMHTKITKDSLGRFLRIANVSDAGIVPEKPGKVRVPHISINWMVTMSSPKTMHIVYTFEGDPGGSIPAWIVNSFADKGPYESFKKLGELLHTP